MLLSLFTNAVQSAFPPERTGEVTASLQFFRFLGSTIGLAVFGTVLSNGFASALANNLIGPLAQAVPPERLQALQPQAAAHLQQTFAAIGPQEQALFEQGLHAIRVSLGMAITSVFLLGAVVMALGLVVTLFLPEIPLRRTRHP
jgi:hypothetical protein